MKLFAFLALALFTAACTTKTLKMTSQETQELFNHSSAKDRLNKYGLKSILTFSDYCDATHHCWDVECHGNSAEVTCWKTPTELSDAIFESATAYEANSPDTHLASCKSTSEDPAKRRNGCFEYLSFLNKYPESTNNEDAPKILKLFCDMKDVSCTKNYVKFGKGDLKTEGLGDSVKKGLYQTPSKTSPGKFVSYLFSILK